MKQGIDVSKWQPKVDWQKVKADGIDFAIIRVGFCYNNSFGICVLACILSRQSLPSSIGTSNSL